MPQPVRQLGVLPGPAPEFFAPVLRSSGVAVDDKGQREGDKLVVEEALLFDLPQCIVKAVRTKLGETGPDGGLPEFCQSLSRLVVDERSRTLYLGPEQGVVELGPSADQRSKLCFCRSQVIHPVHRRQFARQHAGCGPNGNFTARIAAHQIHVFDGKTLRQMRSGANVPLRMRST